ncbi:hypothetical protein MMC30_000231 [Trapelia coarctata]|nr:hypothetical protein [Trapelia coarctata]
MEGYAKLASLMGAYPEIAIVRRFGVLGVQNLLYYQAELVRLEQEFKVCSLENETSQDPDRTKFSKDWFMLAHYNECSEQQWAIMLRIREKLKEYGDALIQQGLLQQLQPPNPGDLEFLQRWMKRPEMGSVYLLGRDSDVWEEPSRDLIALRNRQNDGLYSSCVAESLVRTYHRLVGRHFREPGDVNYMANTVYYSQQGLLLIASLVAMSLSSLLPVAAICTLYSVSSIRVRLGMVAAFTVVFTVCLGLFTKARAIDIFAATTAFAAVQVVFIGTSGSISGG